MPVRQSTAPRTVPPAWTAPPTGTRFLTGARPSPRHKLLSIQPFTSVVAPAQFAIVPAKLNVWGNDQYGDCVTAEEAFAKACHTPEIYIDPSIVIAWARQHGFLNGADLPEVMDAMAKQGFQVGSQLYNDGPYAGVDFSNESNLQAAIAQGNVKLGMASGALPSGAGNQQGWYAIQAKADHNEDHCTGLSGYGSAAYLYQQLGVPLPGGVNFPPICYLLYTWATLGVVSHDWIMGCVGEAFIRAPTTVGVPPLPDPVIPLDPGGWA